MTSPFSSPNQQRWQHHHNENERDPIMGDDHFSFRYDNPIQTIHDMPTHSVADLTPTAQHIPVNISSVLSQESEKPGLKRPDMKRSEASRERDSTTFAEYYHEGGQIEEIDHA
ncbi:hypothetical protein BCR43DRAFT_35731 [Syncephalastrum racemosum]|uniref:Uncharacterized protein n=1 Tax=Syncephalastrum racemosum TaxID=13706 RepID=A0A1X2HVH8_SYNRA|nr:hypothetical protein BCR43DRAFT_35731 [Syncephalastrum racemosum]